MNITECKKLRPCISFSSLRSIPELWQCYNRSWAYTCSSSLSLQSMFTKHCSQFQEHTVLYICSFTTGGVCGHVLGRFSESHTYTVAHCCGFPQLCSYPMVMQSYFSPIMHSQWLLTHCMPALQSCMLFSSTFQCGIVTVSHSYIIEQNCKRILQYIL